MIIHEKAKAAPSGRSRLAECGPGRDILCLAGPAYAEAACEGPAGDAVSLANYIGRPSISYAAGGEALLTIYLHPEDGPTVLFRAPGEDARRSLPLRAVLDLLAAGVKLAG